MTAWMYSCWWTRGECSWKSCFHDVGLVHEGGGVPIGMLYVVGSTCLTWLDRIPCHRRHVWWCFVLVEFRRTSCFVQPMFLWFLLLLCLLQSGLSTMQIMIHGFHVWLRCRVASLVVTVSSVYVQYGMHCRVLFLSIHTVESRLRIHQATSPVLCV